jgi:hypothetical protein
MRLALLLLVTLPAFAQEQEIQRALMERDQRTVEFAARLRGAPPIELQRLENDAARQQLEVRRDLPTELRPYERQQAARDNEAFMLRLPPPVVRPKALEKLRELIEPQPRCLLGTVPRDGAAACD